MIYTSTIPNIDIPLSLLYPATPTCGEITALQIFGSMTGRVPVDWRGYSTRALTSVLNAVVLFYHLNARHRNHLDIEFESGYAAYPGAVPVKILSLVMMAFAKDAKLDIYSRR